MRNVEVLFPELGGLYGDIMNMTYLQQCSKKVNLIYTNNRDIPYFLNHKVDMIYIGPMTEKNQEKCIELLLPYKDRIKDLINKNVIFFVTGNALEIFGKYIMDGDRKIDALNIFDYYSIRDLSDVKSYQSIGIFKEMEIMLHKVHLSFMYENKNPFILKNKGVGNNLNETNEGVNVNNFFGTYSLGPFLILNPRFTEYLLKCLNLPIEIAYKKEIYDAYKDRLIKLKLYLEGIK